MNKDSEENINKSASPAPSVHSKDAGSNDQSMPLRTLCTRLFRQILNTLLALFSAIFIALIMSVLLFVYSQDSREWTVAQGLPALLSVAGIELDIRNLRSPSPSDWTLDSLSVQQGYNEIVRIEQLRLLVNDWSLFKQGLDIQELNAARVYVDLSVEDNEQDPEPASTADFNLHDLFNKPLGLRLQSLDIKRLELTGLGAELPAWSIHGNAFMNIHSSLDIESDHWFNTELALKTLTPGSTQIRLQATLNKRLSGRLDLAIEEAAGGWLAGLIAFPKDQRIDGQLKVQLETDDNHKQIQWQVNAMQLPFYQHQLGLNGSGSWQLKAQKLQIEHAELLVDEVKQKLSGWWQRQRFALDIDLNKLPLSLAEPFQDLIKGGKVSGKVNASGYFSNPEFTSELELDTRILNRPASLKLSAAGDLQTVQIQQAALQIDKARARVSGKVKVEELTLDLKVQQLQGPVSVIEIFDAQLPQGLHIELLQTEGTLTGSILAPRYSGKTKAKGRYKTQAFTLNGGFDGNIEQVKLISAKLQADEAHLNANGLIDWHNGKLDLTYIAKQAPASLLSLAAVELPANLSFQLASEGKIKGAFSQLNLDAKAQLDGLYNTLPFDSTFSVKGTVDKLNFTDFKAKSGDNHVFASGTLEPLKQKFDLQLSQIQVSSKILQTLFPLPEELYADINGKGVLKGEFTQPRFVGKLSTQGRYKDAQFDISTGLDASAEAVEFSELTSQVTRRDQSSRIQANGLYSIQNNTLDGQIKVDKLPLSIIELSDLSLPEGLSGEVNADIKVNGSLPLPRVSGKLETRGEFNGDTYELAFVGNQKDKSIILEDVNARWQNSSLHATGELSKDMLDMQFNLNQFQLNNLSDIGLKLPSGATIPSGVLNIQLDLSGSLEQPKLNGSIELSMEEPLFNAGLKARPENINLKSRIETKTDRLYLHTSILQGETSRADLSLGARFSPLLNWFLDQNDKLKLSEVPLDVSARGDMELAWLNDWLQQDAHFFSGLMNLNMQVAGSFDQPELSGNLAVTDGKYQNAISQTSLEQVNIQLHFDRQKINVLDASANDGQGGQVRLEGAIDLAAPENDQINLSLILDKASLVRREDIEGEASGQLKLIGSLKDMRLSGNLDVTPFQIMLDRITSENIPQIEVRPVQSSNTAKPGDTLQPKVAIDLVINVDQQAFIRGRGLDAELKGKLQLSGTSRQTNYNGRFQVVRGTVDLFAKTFKLEQGSVLFSNEAVSLFAQARHKAKDLTFIATLEGLLDNLKISLRTEPALPEDEAVARLLFGKSVRNITPVQAIQLANAIQTLRGEGGQFDPLGTARDILQVDRITIESQETSEGNGVAIGLGKYVTEKVYVEVTRTPEPTQPWKGSVEVELTPNINLETTTSGSSGFGGVELQWKNDY